MASPEPAESWSNHIHTHTPARTHRTGARGGPANFSRRQKKCYTYIYASTHTQIEIYIWIPALRALLFLPFSSKDGLEL